MRFRANLRVPAVHRNQIQQIDRFVEAAVKEAARIWVRAAASQIPVWSGASRATLQALAAAVDEHVEIDVRGDAPNRIGMGRLQSSGGIERIGEANWQFTYETNLRYLIANETQQVAPRTHGLFGSLIHPTPYMFRDAGNKAVQEYLSKLSIPLMKLQGRKP